MAGGTCGTRGRASARRAAEHRGGPAARITLGGAARQPPAVGGLSPLGHRARAINGSANRAASVTLVAPNVGIDTTSSMAAHAGAALTIAIGAGAAKTVTFDAATFADLA